VGGTQPQSFSESLEAGEGRERLRQIDKTGEAKGSSKHENVSGQNKVWSGTGNSKLDWTPLIDGEVQGKVFGEKERKKSGDTVTVKDRMWNMRGREG